MARVFASNVVVLILALLLSSCGGRAAHPVSATMPYDSQLTCEQIKAERVVNDSRIADLHGEEHDDHNNNVAFIVGYGLMGGMFVDTSGAEKSEIKALRARNAVLDSLIAKQCTAAASAS